MCLETILDNESYPPGLMVKAWKMFGITKEGGPCGLVHPYKFPLNVWEHNRHPITLRTEFNIWITYPTGFHVFTSAEDASTWAHLLGWTHHDGLLCQVYVRRIHTVGRQRGLKVLVADEIHISKETWEEAKL